MDERWRVGQRVSRKDRDEVQGIIVASNGDVKVKWDDGSTSYFKRGQPGNVKLLRSS